MISTRRISSASKTKNKIIATKIRSYKGVRCASVYMWQSSAISLIMFTVNRINVIN